MEPFLTIITINFNNCIGLKKTIQSVVSQSYKNFEFLVIDGGSTDGSKELIYEYQNSIDYSVCETDNGIYDAMNKGIIKANGKYLLFLNSGDLIESVDSLANILPLIDENSDIIACYCQLDFNKIILKAPQNIQFSSFWYKSICHQAVFIKIKLFYTLGLYTTTLKTAADWEFFVKAIFLHNAKYQAIPKILSIIESGGISSNSAVYEQTQIERTFVYETLFPGFIRDYTQLSKYNNNKFHRLLEFVRIFFKSPNKKP